jgi:hypothetical protein
MASFDMKFMYFKLFFVLVILIYLFFVVNYQNDPDIQHNDFSKFHSSTAKNNTIICDKQCAQTCIDSKDNKPIDIVRCFGKCACPEEISAFKSKSDKKLTFLEKVNHTIIFGFAIIIILFLYRNFENIVNPQENIYTDYRKIATNDDYVQM